MEKLKKEFEQLFTKNATEITACPRIRLYGNPQELWLWILNNFTPKVSRVELPVKPEIAEDKFKFAIKVLNEIEGQMHQMENIEGKTFNRIMNFIVMRRNFLHKKQ